MLLDSLHPLLGSLGPVVRLAKEFPLPLLKTSQKLLARTTDTNVAGFFRRTALPLSNSASHLPGVKGDLGSSRNKRLSQRGTERLLVGEIHHVRRKGVKVRALVAQGNGAWVGFQRLLDVVSQRRGEIEIDKGFIVNVAHVGNGQHLGYPEGKQYLGARLKGLPGLVVEVAELGDVELECAWYFLWVRVCQLGVRCKLGGDF